MTLTLDLSPELEAQLEAEAARNGQDVKTFATATLAQVLSTNPAPFALAPDTTTPSLAEFDAALDELEFVSEDIPVPDASITHSREDIYFDHD